MRTEQERSKHSVHVLKSVLLPQKAAEVCLPNIAHHPPPFTYRQVYHPQPITNRHLPLRHHPPVTAAPVARYSRPSTHGPSLHYPSTHGPSPCTALHPSAAANAISRPVPVTALAWCVPEPIGPRVSTRWLPLQRRRRYMSRKSESLERIYSLHETNATFDYHVADVNGWFPAVSTSYRSQNL